MKANRWLPLFLAVTAILSVLFLLPIFLFRYFIILGIRWNLLPPHLLFRLIERHKQCSINPKSFCNVEQQGD